MKCVYFETRLTAAKGYPPNGCDNIPGQTLHSGFTAGEALLLQGRLYR